MSSFRAAAIQMRSGVDPQRNANDLAGYVADAVGQGAVYVQTPEMTGALQRDRKALADVLRAEEDDVIVRSASELAAEHGIHLHIGSTAIAREDGKIANRAFLFGPDGKIITRYDKIHMFDVDLDNGESWREFVTSTIIILHYKVYIGVRNQSAKTRFFRKTTVRQIILSTEPVQRSRHRRWKRRRAAKRGLQPSPLRRSYRRHRSGEPGVRAP